MTLKRLNVLSRAHVPHVGFLITALITNKHTHNRKKMLLLGPLKIYISDTQTNTLSLSISPQRQKCFQSQMGRGPGTRHQLCDHGNSAAAARSPHPTRHMCHHRWRSGSNPCIDVHRQIYENGVLEQEQNIFVTFL